MIVRTVLWMDVVFAHRYVSSTDASLMGFFLVLYSFVCVLFSL
jgi:hypothetical protein